MGSATTAAWTVLLEAQRIRCWVHNMRSILDKVAEEVVARFPQAYPSAMSSFEDDLEASLAHLELTAVHRKHIRTTNLIERSFEEERRRAKVMPRFRTEEAPAKSTDYMRRSFVQRGSVRYDSVSVFA